MEILVRPSWPASWPPQLAGHPSRYSRSTSIRGAAYAFDDVAIRRADGVPLVRRRAAGGGRLWWPRYSAKRANKMGGGVQYKTYSPVRELVSQGILGRVPR
jgi:hypothetical protein